jgi:uncharacterized protein YegL
MNNNQKFLDDLKVALNVARKANLYTAQINRKQPTAFIFLLDQSGSMHEKIKVNNSFKSKSEFAAMVINETLNELLVRATKANDTRDYYDIAIIGYGSDSHKANIAWTGNLSNHTWVNMTELNQGFISKDMITQQKKTRKGIEEIEVERKIWIKPISENQTPMKSALLLAKKLLEQWIVKNSGLDCYPPTIINITDGEATDADNDELIDIAHQIKALGTQDGNTLLFNVHISDSASNSIVFPESTDELPNDIYAKTLFEMSSDMPQVYLEEISKVKAVLQKNVYKAMSFNADSSQIVNMMNIGTSQTNKAGQSIV